MLVQRPPALDEAQRKGRRRLGDHAHAPEADDVPGVSGACA
jgi:hypothetical protein